MKFKKLLINFFIIMFSFSCSSHNPKIYANNSPQFDIRNYFRGNLEAYGILQDRSGKVIKTFTVKMKGSWKNNQGTLEEHFIFSDGKKDQRTWNLSMIDDNNFIGKAHDVVGEAKGEQYGNAVKMNYILTIPVDNKKYDVKISDWMYLVDKDSLINVSVLSKFGFRVATLTIGFKKLGI